jgi:hypothetical protein
MTDGGRVDGPRPARRGLWLWIIALVVVLVAAVQVVTDGSDLADGVSSTDGGDVTAGGDGCRYWVAPAPEGDDDAPGTQEQPWATLEHAAATVPDDGCTVSFAAGVYQGPNNLNRRFDTPTTFVSATPHQAVLEHDQTVLDIDGGRNITLEGFELRHTGSETPESAYVAIVDRRDDTWSEDITFRDNIFHDSYGDDLLKVHNGVRFATVDGNVFYNQGGNEQCIDVNSVTDVEIHDNIFFGDYAASDREPDDPAKHFIVVKDSNEDDDGLEGTRDVAIRRNIFLSWDGGIETLVTMGNDGKPYYEAQDVIVENNLVLGNSSTPADAAFGVRGARDIVFNNNTVVGDFPSDSFAYNVDLTGDNPVNEDIRFTNNIWADPTGTMGSDDDGSDNKFADGDPDEVEGLVNDTNLYWNGGGAIPDGIEASPLEEDPHALSAEPGLQTDHTDVVLPIWDGERFASGNSAIRDEFVRIVDAYGAIQTTSPAVDAADPASAAADDILGRRRDTPDLGAYEADGGDPS